MATTLPRFLRREDFQQLIDALRAAGYRCLGPRVEEGAIVFDTLVAMDQLPSGYRDRQAPGEYHLERGDDGRLFAWVNGPQALKPLTFTPRETLWRAERRDDGTLHLQDVPPEAEPLAVIGIRSCDLAALALQDAHFLHKTVDAGYRARREKLFLVAVNCSRSAATCFCVSTGDGPGVHEGADLILSELDEGFIVQAGSQQADSILSRLSLHPVSQEQLGQAEKELQAAANQQQRGLPGRNLRDSLFANLDHPRWREVAERCLSCGNCVSVCPTCFCHGAREQPALDGTSTEHSRQWDSCYTAEHSYIHGLLIRADTRTRYRQWLTHKLGGWHDQYGRSGCVGCGRCITWCPVGIDITEEATAICAGEDP